MGMNATDPKDRGLSLRWRIRARIVDHSVRAYSHHRIGAEVLRPMQCADTQQRRSDFALGNISA